MNSYLYNSDQFKNLILDLAKENTIYTIICPWKNAFNILCWSLFPAFNILIL